METKTKKQLTVRGLIIGSLGSIILTASSMYVALKLGALPWPIIFVALVSMFSLKLLGNTNINEINVTHTAMSAGAMVAGGLAFTIPAFYMMNGKADEISFPVLLLISIGGVLLSLAFTGLIHKNFIIEQNLPYPMGQAAAETLVIGDEGGKKSRLLFGAFSASALFTVLRDWTKNIPAIVPLNSKLINSGVAAYLWLSPMLIAVGYTVGPLYIGVWFLGSLIGDLGIVFGGVSTGAWDLTTAGAIKSSLGIGVMVGCGLGIIAKNLLPQIKKMFSSISVKSDLSVAPIGFIIFAIIASIPILTFGLKIPFVAVLLTIAGLWLACCMSAQAVGLSGINPMEVFAVIILLLIALVITLSPKEAIFIAAIIAVGSGLTGDIMNDFKAGHIVKSNPKSQWIAEAVGGIVGAFVASGVFFILIKAYGTDIFGPDKMFPAPQAGLVAAMAGGIPHMSAFLIGFSIGFLAYVTGLPVMTLGLGIYLPFYLSLTAAIGGALRFISIKFAPKFEESGKGGIIAPGLLGGEAFVGVLIALVQAISALSGK
ncbi:MAG: peptide transporter [Ruminococcaceae bacterium]|nr:peptide transporter [Oscillospiraceae bacterium]